MYKQYLDILTKLLTYPDQDLPEFTQEALGVGKEDCPEFSGALTEFLSGIEKEDLQRLREVYTTTFDLKSMTCMDVGYVLFGEDYKRGAFLVEMQRLCKENNVDTGSELPDHLPNVLRLLSAMPDSQERTELIEKIMLPAISRMLGDFDRNVGAKNYYEYPLRALQAVTEINFNMNGAVLKGAY